MMEAIQRACVPEALQVFFDETDSVSLSGDPNTGEGLDFKAEVVNRDVQSWMPRGVPDGNDWLRITRNLDKLKKLRQKSKELHGVQQAVSGPKFHDLSEQVSAWRVHLRETQYLASPCDGSQPHVSVDGKELDCNLINFQETSSKRRQESFDMKYGSDDDTLDETPIVFVTKEERDDYERLENQPKSAIVEKLVYILNSVDDEDYRQTFISELNAYKSKLSRTKRDILIMFYNKVQDVLKNQDLSRDVNEDDVEKDVNVSDAEKI